MNATNSFTQRMLYFFMLATAATVFFVVFTQREFDELLAPAIPDPGYRYMAIVILFFIVIYLFDRIIEAWRSNNTTTV